MNDALIEGGQEEIIRKILSEAETRAKRIVDNAGRSAEAEKNKARAESEKVRRAILDQAGHKASALKAKEVAGAHIEAKRILLRAREEAISRVFEAVRGELDKLHGDPARYRDALVNLAVEAVRAIGEEEVAVAVGKDDENLATPEVVSEIQAALQREGVKGLKVDLVVDRGVVGGGCVARSMDARVVFDNTFSRRLERMRPSLRSEIVNEVLKRDG